MDKQAKKNITWSLDYILKYVKNHSDSEVFDPSFCIMHLEDAIKILKQEETIKKQEK